ncbi:hypothetical protein K505DRAFT_64011 [Melanomma pulvis-pyrius CBS 109.77]|uniref:Uncharacterized protein n=1 Tax=Melanomma pulvis-pyrius CBS 109.77 TaxID=1314802 RepID=A0A6A6X5T2_9PLEO|nr:hypothetical protein K505DRAFT_64011 [Melanomma pulvis-pyrius CBS 109.77]
MNSTATITSGTNEPLDTAQSTPVHDPTAAQFLPSLSSANGTVPAKESSSLIREIGYHTLRHLVGLGFALPGVFLIFYLLILLLEPFITMYIAADFETSSWASQHRSKPCPQHWKDGLDDTLWVFW